MKSTSGLGSIGIGLVTLAFAGLDWFLKNPPKIDTGQPAGSTADKVHQAVGRGIMGTLSFFMSYMVMAAGVAGIILILVKLSKGSKSPLAIVGALIGIGLCVWASYIGWQIFQDYTH